MESGCYHTSNLTVVLRSLHDSCTTSWRSVHDKVELCIEWTASIDRQHLKLVSGVLILLCRDLVGLLKLWIHRLLGGDNLSVRSFHFLHHCTNYSQLHLIPPLINFCSFNSPISSTQSEPWIYILCGDTSWTSARELQLAHAHSATRSQHLSLLQVTSATNIFSLLPV